MLSEAGHPLGQSRFISGKKLIITLIIIHCSVLIVYAQWQKINIIENANISLMTKDSSGYVYAITSNNKIYRSTNNGDYWLEITNGMNLNILSIISTPTSLLIGTYGNGIFRSTNYGQTWISSNSGITTYYIYIESFCVKDNFVFAGTQNGIYRSSNDGISWIKTSDGVPFIHGISAMVSTNNYIFAETHIGSQGTMYVSTNNGEIWNVANSGLPDFFTTSLSVSGNTVFTTEQQVYQTSNFGMNWLSTPGLPPVCGNILLSVSARGNIVAVSFDFTANNQNVYISTNYGSSFYPTGSGLPDGGVNTCLITNNCIFAATTKGIYKSTNYGLNWFGINNGFPDVDFLAVLSESSVVLAGSNGHGVYRSTNSGLTWNLISSLNSASTCYNFLRDVDRIYSLGTYGFVFTYDFGEYWNYVPLAGPPAGNILKYYTKDFLIIGAYNGGIYKTSTYGINWNKCETGITPDVMQVNNIFINDSIALIHVCDSNLNNKLYRSTNQGDSWNLIVNSGLPNKLITCFVQNQNNIYAGTPVGIYISTNNGNNWIPKNNGLIANISSIHSKNGILYAGTFSSGVYRSTDNANSWQPYNEGIANNIIYSVSSGTSKLFSGGNSSFYFRTIQTSVNNLGSNIPSAFSLCQNYPNPFNPTTKIKFDIAKKSVGQTFLSVYDILGREVVTLVNEQLAPGTYSVDWDASVFTSGVYFYRLSAGDFSDTKRMLLIK